MFSCQAVDELRFFFQMEDNLNFFIQMEDDLNILANGRRTQYFG